MKPLIHRSTAERIADLRDQLKWCQDGQEGASIRRMLAVLEAEEATRCFVCGGPTYLYGGVLLCHLTRMPAANP